MNKSDLVNLIAARTELKKHDINQVINSLVDIIIESVTAGKSIKIIGFGKFDRITRKARVGMNPHAGERINLPEKKAVRFSAGKPFKDALE